MILLTKSTIIKYQDNAITVGDFAKRYTKGDATALEKLVTSIVVHNKAELIIKKGAKIEVVFLKDIHASMFFPKIKSVVTVSPKVKQDTKSIEHKHDLSESFYTHLAGVTKNKRQQSIINLRFNEELTLIREPHNPFDKNAVAVYAGDKYSFEQIGYIPSDIAQKLAKLIDSGMKYDCTIKELNSFVEGTVKYIGVVVNVLKVKVNNTKPIYEDDDENESWSRQDFNEYYGYDEDYDGDYHADNN
jgi:hypothetical protein